MKLTEKTSKRYERDLRRMRDRGKDMQKIFDVIKLLRTGEPLPPRYKDHPLKGEWFGFRECHIEDDWILIYRIDKGELLLYLTRTGTHDDLF
ncbi:MAG: type II toxin-antitoxin system YafQ family toxin [Selenomonadaceae bacterium]|nr:type II toxin-antitoxin system YafQ family toxin [Selenomonadaceae bacterium]